MKNKNNSSKGAIGYVIIFALAAVACGLVAALLMNIFERKAEAMNPYVRLVEVTEDTTDPEVWGVNWPKQYESYLLTAESTRTRFGGHGGSEALPTTRSSPSGRSRPMFETHVSRLRLLHRLP